MRKSDVMTQDMMMHQSNPVTACIPYANSDKINRNMNITLKTKYLKEQRKIKVIIENDM